MTDDNLRELENLWREHGDRRLPPLVAGDAELLDLRHDLIAYDSRIASGVLAVLAGNEPLHPLRFERHAELLDRLHAWAASQPDAAAVILADYEAYVLALDRLGEKAERVWHVRHSQAPN
jgi:hypothetical protein